MWYTSSVKIFILLFLWQWQHISGQIIFFTHFNFIFITFLLKDICLSHTGWCCNNCGNKQGRSRCYVNTNIIVSNTTYLYYNVFLYCLYIFDCDLHFYWTFYFEATLYIIGKTVVQVVLFKRIQLFIILYTNTKIRTYKIDCYCYC